MANLGDRCNRANIVLRVPDALDIYRLRLLVDGCRESGRVVGSDELDMNVELFQKHCGEKKIIRSTSSLFVPIYDTRKGELYL